MRRTIDNDFELTGPIERGDWETVEAHRRAIRAARPELEPFYDVLAEATREVRVARTIPALRLALSPGRVGLVPTMGAFHEGHLSLMQAARAECNVVVVSLFVNPAQFGPNDDLKRYPRDEERDVRLAEEAGVDVLFIPSAEVMYPKGFGTWVEVEDTGGEGDGTTGSLSRRGDRLSEAVQHRAPGRRVLRPEGRTADRGDSPHGARPRA